MRGREFLVKFPSTSMVLQQERFVAYLRNFEPMAQGNPDARRNGHFGADLSHEFIVLAENGASLVDDPTSSSCRRVSCEEIDYDGDSRSDHQAMDRRTPRRRRSRCGPGRNVKIPAKTEFRCGGLRLGQIFYFGTKYSEAMKTTVAGADAPRRRSMAALMELGYLADWSELSSLRRAMRGCQMAEVRSTGSSQLGARTPMPPANCDFDRKRRRGSVRRHRSARRRVRRLRSRASVGPRLAEGSSGGATAGAKTPAWRAEFVTVHPLRKLDIVGTATISPNCMEIGLWMNP